MSQPREVEALTAALLADLTAVHEQILTALDALAADWYDLNVTARIGRLTELDRQISVLIDYADAIAAGHVVGAVQAAYEIGAWSTALSALSVATFGGIDVDAVTALAQDTYADLLTATKGMRDDAKHLIRELARDQVRTKLLTGQTAIQAGRDLARSLRDRGVTAVIYSDGRQVSLPTYAEMLLRTKTAQAYQEGGLNQGERLGIEWWEILDGPGCGWTAHDDPQIADGMIVPTETARAYPIAHPNCRRSSTPRPDIRSARDAAGATRTSPTDQAQVWAQAVKAQATAGRATALSTTPTRTAAVATIPNTAAGRRFAQTLKRHTA